MCHPSLFSYFRTYQRTLKCSVVSLSLGTEIPSSSIEAPLFLICLNTSSSLGSDSRVTPLYGVSVIVRKVVSVS